MGKGIVKLGEGNWAVKDGNLLAAKETNGRFKNAEFTVDRGSDATYVGRDGLIKSTSSNIESEVFLNPTFDTTIPLGNTGSGWTDSGLGEVTFYNGGLKITGEGVGTAKARARDATNSSAILETSRLYELTYTIKSISSKNNTLSLYMAGNTHTITQKSVGTHTILVASGTNANKIFQFQWAQSDDESIVFSSVSLKESLVANGTFDSDSDWTTLGDWTISGGLASCNGSSIMFTNASITANKTYKVTYTVSGFQSGGVKIKINGSPDTDGLVRTSNGTYTEYITSSSSVNGNFSLAAVVSFVGSIDNVSVFEVDNGALPRIDFTDNTDGHLLLEPESRNLIAYSEDFRLNSNYTTTAPSNIFESGYLAPDGSLTATRINGFDGYYVALSGTETGDSKSMYVKSGNGQTGNVNLLDINEQAHSLFEVTNEWKRVELVGNDSWFYIVDGRGASLTLDDIIVWGLQQEDLSYATSYIPTNGSTVTRDAETCTGAGEAIDFNSEEGVLYAEIAAFSNDDSYRYFGLTDGTDDNRVIILYYNNNDRIRVLLSSGDIKYLDEYYTVSSLVDFHKIALKWKVNDFALWIDGVERATDTSGSAPIGLNTLAFDQAGGSNFYGKCKAIRVYKEALSDSELTTLTS